uniref:winged helix-turn-helix domain-containing protein n=1 Tax=Scandinavium goeteborgense TaxID=1851514 RepID=UPI001356EE1A|nr:helix-turn-helix domain-containing protein [Scandinavium goeteborgense]
MNREEISLSPAVTFVPDKSCLASREYGDIHLTPNERRLLELIISGKSKKETVFEEIWHSQGTIVSESSYHQLIKMLRRKLQYAGLPGSIIKTIPRYGIVLASCEPAATVDENQESPVEASTCIEADPDAVQPDVFSEKPPLFSAFASRFLLAFCAVVILVLPLSVPLLMEKPQAFQERITLDGVTFHFSSRRSIDRAGLVQKRQALPEGINNVYIASNGPKVFVARCEGELSKEGKCSYDYYSSY